MALRDIVDIRTEIDISEDVSFSVRGLSTEDLAHLSDGYSGELDELFKGKVDFGLLIKQAPHFVAHAIALAADEPEGLKSAQKMAFGVQVKALKVIYDLTFPDEDFLGKLLNQFIESAQELREKLVSVKPEETPAEITGLK